MPSTRAGSSQAESRRASETRLAEIRFPADRGIAATGWAGAGQLRVPIGRVDKPAEQKQDVMTVDLTGHLLVVGNDLGSHHLLLDLAVAARDRF